MSRYNNPKKDKSSMVQRNNNRIATRGIEEANFNQERYSNRMDVDRLMLERQMTAHNFGNPDDDYVGEVTGEILDGSDVYDKGMPVRSTFTVKRSRYDNNSHLDFENIL